jgi:hypothetical protein
MAAATAVESASTVESASASTVESASTMESTSGPTVKSAAKARTTRETATAETTTAEATTTETATAVESTAEETASVEPWASADEEAIHEPVRAVVAIGSARVRIIIIITVRADGSWTVAIWVWCNTDAKADPHLPVGTSGEGKSENPKQNRVFQMSHVFNQYGPKSQVQAVASPGKLAWGGSLQHEKPGKRKKVAAVPWER